MYMYMCVPIVFLLLVVSVVLPSKLSPLHVITATSPHAAHADFGRLAVVRLGGWPDGDEQGSQPGGVTLVPPASPSSLTDEPRPAGLLRCQH